MKLNNPRSGRLRPQKSQAPIPLQTCLHWLKQHSNAANVAGMARFGINPTNTLGISVVGLRAYAKRLGRNHALAQKLWKTKLHEGRLLAAFIEEPQLVTEAQAEAWVKDFDSWDICDQVCSNVFDRTPFAWRKSTEWAKRPEEFVRRAGFVMMAALAVHDKKADDTKFLPFFRLILKYSDDERNFVRKAINWALRQIGKRNPRLGKLAVHAAKMLAHAESKSARWIGSDALREFHHKKIR